MMKMPVIWGNDKQSSKGNSANQVERFLAFAGSERRTSELLTWARGTDIPLEWSNAEEFQRLMNYHKQDIMTMSDLE